MRVTESTNGKAGCYPTNHKQVIKIVLFFSPVFYCVKFSIVGIKYHLVSSNSSVKQEVTCIKTDGAVSRSVSAFIILIVKQCA